MTYWNFSWVDPADQSGWVPIEIRENINGSDYCEIDDSDYMIRNQLPIILIQLVLQTH